MSSLTEEGKHNVRGNTGAIVVIPQLDGSEKTILIDCGKTFRESAIKVFPKNKLRRIDACILSREFDSISAIWKSSAIADLRLSSRPSRRCD